MQNKSTSELAAEFLAALDKLPKKPVTKPEYQMSEVYRETGMTRNRCKFCGFAFTACICED